MLIRSISLFLLAAILFIGFFIIPPSLAMAQLQQQQQQQTTTTTTTRPPPSSSLSITTTPPLTPEEQEQQNRLQSTIAATTRDLNETEKQIAGVVFTPRWSEPLWVNPNSIAVIIAYCLPGEFADSGQEILGGFGLEVLESYAVDLPQGFMAWMAVVGNEDGNVRLPAALGVICASDLNRPDTRILSPQEQQQINNINQQFSTIQNTQITNIDQVIDIIDNATTETTTEEQPFRVEASVNPTSGSPYDIFTFDANPTGGTPPYSYTWSSPNLPYGYVISSSKSFTNEFNRPRTYNFTVTVSDSKNQTASDSIQLTVGQPFTVEIIPNATSGFVRDRFELKANIRNGTEPYTYSWDFVGDFLDFSEACNLLDDPTAEVDLSCIVFDINQAGTHEVELSVTDSNYKTATGSIQITVRERPQGGGGLLGEGILDNATVAGEGFRAGIIANATQVYTGSTIKFDASIRGGAPPYSYSWSSDLGLIDQDRSITLNFFEPGTFTYFLTATDSNGQTTSDSIQITVEERPQGGVLLPPETGEEGQPLGGGLLPRTPPPPPPPPNDNEVISPPEGGGEEEPPTTTEEEGGEEPSPPPPSDDTEEEGAGESPPDEEPTTPPDGG